MSMSITPHASSPPRVETRRDRTVGSPSEARQSYTRASASDETRRTASVVDRRATNNQIGRDTTTGLMVMRTVDVKTGEVLAQNPTEAYLRLAHAMTATVRAEQSDRAPGHNLETNVVA